MRLGPGVGSFTMIKGSMHRPLFAAMAPSAVSRGAKNSWLAKAAVMEGSLGPPADEGETATLNGRRSRIRPHRRKLMAYLSCEPPFG